MSDESPTQRDKALSIASLCRASSKELAQLLLEFSLRDPVLRERLATFAETLSTREVSLPPMEQTYMLGNSPAMSRVFNEIRRYAPTDACVLIRGERGTGKKFVAQALHERSSWAGGPFISIHCGALPASLIGSELFGHEKRVFGRPKTLKIGRIENAEGGTLFLKEIEQLPLENQAQLLRFLQERTIERIGGSGPILVSARVIAATHQDLREAVQHGHFLADLFHRLNVLGIHLPPLRERDSDLQLLARFFLERFSRNMERSPLVFSPAAERALSTYAWPGNVSELIASLRRAVVMTSGATVEREALGLPTLENDNQHSQDAGAQTS
jgi:DNA-binding NtrC family response regulator